MKKALMMIVAATALCAVAQEVSLADARAKIGDVVSDPAALTSLIKQLSAGDQKTFLADVNEAISKMPGSNESKAATFLNANRAALKGVQKSGNVATLLAEVFATVPVEALTVINERFASDLFNRGADPSMTFTDEQYTKLAQDVMTKIAERNASADDAAVRDAFAILMFVRASNGTPADLSSKLLDYIPEGSREVAKTDWLPSALAEEKSYEPMLGAANAGQAPNLSSVVRIAGPQMLDAMLFDLNNGMVNASGYPTTAMMDAQNATAANLDSRAMNDGGMDSGLDRVPFTSKKPVVLPPKPEPKPYQGQSSY